MTRRWKQMPPNEFRQQLLCVVDGDAGQTPVIDYDFRPRRLSCGALSAAPTAVAA